jgi:hypothetical protein
MSCIEDNARKDGETVVWGKLGSWECEREKSLLLAVLFRQSLDYC